MSSGSTSTSAETLVSIVSHLGGANIVPADIEREVDFPAGKKLVEWLVDQLQCDEESYGNRQDRKLLYQAALGSVALHDEELQMLKRVRPEAPSTDREELTSIKPPGYVQPSDVRARITYMESESSLLESETALLKHRLRQTKLAAQRTAQIIKSLKSAIEGADRDIGEKKEQIEELSILADASISSSTSEALQLLDTIKLKSDQDSTTTTSNVPDESRLPMLSKLSTLRSSIISHYASQRLHVENEGSLILKAEEIREEAGRLDEAFRKGAKRGAAMKDGRHATLAQAAQEAAYQEELAKVCDSLDGGGTIEAILSEMDASHPLGEDVIDIDVKGEMERAWNLDQACVLGAKGRILDDALTTFQSHLLPSLTGLYEILSKTDAHVREAEALAGALGEEIEQVVDNVRQGAERGNSSPGQTIEDFGDEVLESELIQLLKSLKDLRRKDAPPLVLLDRADVLTELRSLAERDRVLEEREEQWANELPRLLEDLSNTHTPFLSAIYAHSPVNTSPPFMPPPHLLSLENEARRKGEELAAVVQKLEQDVETLQNSRTTRKLGAFVAKWGK